MKIHLMTALWICHVAWAEDRSVEWALDNNITWVVDSDGKRPEPKIIVKDACAWPNLTRLPDGTIIALIYNQPSHGQMPGDVDCWASEDEGKTWVKRSVAAPRGEPAQNRMNVAAGLTADGDLILITSGWSDAGNPEAQGLPNLGKPLQPRVCISKDGGNTWAIDKDGFPAGPDNRYLIPFGDIMPGADGKLRVAAYRGPDDEAAQKAAKEKGDKTIALASKGCNWIVIGDGKHWEKPIAIARRIARHNETALLHLGEGRWIAAARRSGLTLYFSDDDARSWMRYDDAVDKSVRRGRIIAGHPGHLMRLKDGTTMLSFGNRNKTNLGVDVMFSSDEGRSWCKPYRILKTGTADSGYPSSVQLDNGNILTAYYSKITPYHRGYHMGIVIWDPVKTRSQ